MINTRLLILKKHVGATINLTSDYRDLSVQILIQSQHLIVWGNVFLVVFQVIILAIGIQCSSQLLV